VPILWAADVTVERVTRARARDAQRWITLRDRDRFMLLTAPAVLVQRTTAPEQPRRLVAGHLDEAALARWGGALVVENHVNVLRRSTAAPSPLSPRLLTALLNSTALDRLYRCLTGSVAVSAYELEALPLPPTQTIAAWNALPHPELVTAIEDFYG
jgi:adenine-specific DNA-methyltransferase